MSAANDVKANEYRCARCSGIFEKRWTDEEALAEKVANGWGHIAEDQCEVVCDDCYQQFMGWYRTAEGAK